MPCSRSAGMKTYASIPARAACAATLFARLPVDAQASVSNSNSRAFVAATETTRSLNDHVGFAQSFLMYRLVQPQALGPGSRARISGVKPGADVDRRSPRRRAAGRRSATSSAARPRCVSRVTCRLHRRRSRRRPRAARSRTRRRWTGEGVLAAALTTAQRFGERFLYRFQVRHDGIPPADWRLTLSGPPALPSGGPRHRHCGGRGSKSRERDGASGSVRSLSSRTDKASGSVRPLSSRTDKAGYRSGWGGSRSMFLVPSSITHKEIASSVVQKRLPPCLIVPRLVGVGVGTVSAVADRLPGFTGPSPPPLWIRSMQLCLECYRMRGEVVKACVPPGWWGQLWSARSRPRAVF